ncbi:P-loop containing nucleoside triphosphate hydrolases superfamily protein, partial [Striga hermonthica]
ETEKAARYLRKYFEIEGVLYKKSMVGPHLRCVSEEEGDHVLREIYEGCCGAHIGSRALAGKALRAGYYWPKIRKAVERLVQVCDKCQRHGRIPHIPAEAMTTINCPIPFAQWGIDLVGPLLMGTEQRKFMVVAIDYFSKWVEAEPLAKITEDKMIQFLFNNICCRFGIPKILISDNGTQFQGKRIQAWCVDMGIKQRFASVAHPQANGKVEVTNRTILQGLKKRLEKASGSWVDELTTVLWAYRTTPRSSTGQSPFHMVYGMEALLPIEVGLESHRSTFYEEKNNEELAKGALDMIEEMREEAWLRSVEYKQKMRATFDKKVRARRFQVGDLVLKRADALKHVGKLEANWEGPYTVTRLDTMGRQIADLSAKIGDIRLTIRTMFWDKKTYRDTENWGVYGGIHGGRGGRGLDGAPRWRSPQPPSGDEDGEEIVSEVNSFNDFSPPHVEADPFAAYGSRDMQRRGPVFVDGDDQHVDRGKREEAAIVGGYRARRDWEFDRNYGRWEGPFRVEISEFDEEQVDGPLYDGPPVFDEGPEEVEERFTDEVGRLYNGLQIFDEEPLGLEEFYHVSGIKIQLLEELVVLLLCRPKLFSHGNLLRPCKQMLFYCPHGDFNIMCVDVAYISFHEFQGGDTME